MKSIQTIKKIEMVSIENLVPYENNARINGVAVPKVAASIKKFGFNVPIVLENNSNVIVCGHTRLRAAMMLRDEEGYDLNMLPCVRVGDLTKEQIRAYRLADNKTAEISQWDFDKLEKELADIGKSIDMEEFGFIDTSIQMEESGLPPELKGRNLEPEQLGHKGEEAKAESRIMIVFDEERRHELEEMMGVDELPVDRVIYPLDHLIEMRNGEA